MVAGLVRDPDRDIPRATLGGVLIAGIVYIVSSALVMGIVPAAELEASSSPFALVAAEIFGPWAASATAAAAALNATGTLRSEEHTTELHSLTRTPYAVICLQQTKNHQH